MSQTWYDIYPAVHRPFWESDLFIALGAGLCLVFLLCMVVFLWRWRARRKTGIALPLWQQALADIEDLEKDFLIASLASSRESLIDEYKIFYTRLMMIHRAYFSKRYDPSAAGRTDAELEDCLKEFGLPGSICLLWHNLVEHATLARFALSSEAAVDQLKKDLALSKEIVRATIPVVDEHASGKVIDSVVKKKSIHNH